MKNMLIHLNSLILLGICFSALPLGKAQQSPAEETLGQQAEQARRLREALMHYVAALQGTTEGSDAERRLQERIINVALKLKPPPTLPPGAVRFEGRAEAAVHAANDRNDFFDAAKEYRAALHQAAWYAPYYFNLGVVLEKAGRPDEAIRSFKLYLLAAPNASDAVVVQKKIGELEYQIDKAAKARSQAEAEQAARSRDAEERRSAEEQRKRDLPRLLGGAWKDEIGNIYRGNVSGNRVEIYEEQYCYSGNCNDLRAIHRLQFAATVEEGQIKGTWVEQGYEYGEGKGHKCRVVPGNFAGTGELSFDGFQVEFRADISSTCRVDSRSLTLVRVGN